jgi:hypothetical protein
VTVEFYDLAQRLHAAQHSGPVLTVAGSLFTVSPDAIYLQAAAAAGAGAAGTVTVRGQSGRAVTASGVRALRALAAAGARMDPFGQPVQLVIPDGASLAVLAGIARTHATHPDEGVRAASAVVGWWVDRAGYPGTGAVVNLLTHSRQRYITGAVPGRERHASHWRQVFGVGDGIAGLVAWAARISRGEVIAALSVVAEDDAYTYTAAVQRFVKGRDWTVPEPPPVAAMGLRVRCDTADVWEAALLSDRLYRQRAVHTGHVTGGQVTAATRAFFTIACPRLDSRLRVGADVVGWVGGVDSYERATRFCGHIHAAHAQGGALVLTVAGIPVAVRPSFSDWVTLMPAPPNQSTVRMGRSRYRWLLFRGDSWIATGKTPGVRRRDVPLDVLCAAAETE